jgi:putative ABC transport system permease protein
MWADVKYALRQLRKSPGFTLTAVLTLAIGIGANTAVFSLMDAVILRPLAVPDLGRVMTLAEHQDRGEPKQVAFANYEDWKRQSRSFEDLAVRTYGYMNMSGVGDAAHVQTALVSPNFFALLGVDPWIGRVFRQDEAQPGRDAVTILSYRFWQRQFGGDPGIVGRRVELDSRAYTVIGVMPKSLEYPSVADLFLPLALTPQQRNDRVARNYLVIGRLRAGVSVQAAQGEMQGIASQLSRQYPATNLGWSVTMAPLLKDLNGPLTSMYFRLIMGATIFVLLVVCANVANLQFARGLGRRNEIAVRTALGARRRVILRQLLVESVIVALVGAAAGLLLAQLDLHLALLAMPARVARYISGWGTISLNGRALGFSILLAVGAGIVSGIAPSLEALRVNLVDQLKAGGRSSTGTGQTHRLRNLFAIAQISLAVSLVIGAALMAKGMYATLHMADIYHPAQILTFDVHLPLERYATAQKQEDWYKASLSRIRALPGVKSAEVTTGLPYGNEGTWVEDFQIENRPLVPGQFQGAARLTVSSGFLNAIGIPIVAGRSFNDSDGSGATPVAIVSRKFADLYFSGTSPLGHRIRMGAERQSEDPWVTIVGVAADAHYDWTNENAQKTVYLNAAQTPLDGAKYVIVADGDPLALAPAVRQSLTALDNTLPLDAMQTYQGYLREALTGLMYAASMLAVDAGIALLLAAIGIFGVMANLVGERRREIGLRLILGARREDVAHMFLRRAGTLTAIGITAGIGIAAVLARLAASLLFGVHPGDPAVFVTTAVAIAGIALLASWLPARVAASVDPIDALREE